MKTIELNEFAETIRQRGSSQHVQAEYDTPRSVECDPQRKDTGVAKLDVGVKLAIRETVMISMGFVLPYIPQYERVTGDNGTLSAIYLLALTLLPRGNKYVGTEIDVCIKFLVGWPLYLLMLYIPMWIGPYTFGLYVFSFALCVLPGILYGFMHPNDMFPVLICILTYCVALSRLYQTFKYLTPTMEPEERYHQAKMLLSGTTLALMTPVGLHGLGSVIIFPLYAFPEMRLLLAKKWQGHAQLLKQLWLVFGTSTRYVLWPNLHKQYMSIYSNGEIDGLVEAVDRCALDEIKLRALIPAALMESRWKFSGQGLRMLDELRVANVCSRHARGSAYDMILKIKRMTREYEKNPRVKEEITQRDVESYSIEGHETTKKEFFDLISGLNQVLEDSSKVVSELVGQSEKSSSALEELLEQQMKMRRLWNDLRKHGVWWLKTVLGKQAQMWATNPVKNRLPGDEPLAKTKFFTYLVSLEQNVGAHEEAFRMFHAPGFQRSFAEVLREWKLSLGSCKASSLFTNPEDSDGFSRPSHTWPQRFVSGFFSVLNSDEFTCAKAFTLGNLFLFLLGTMPFSYKIFTDIYMLNAVFTFQVSLYKFRVGLIFERVKYRLCGVFLGGVFGIIVWELSCLFGQCGNVWAVYLLGLVPVMFYAWYKVRFPTKDPYFAFATVRTYVSLIGPLASEDAGTKTTLEVLAPAGWVFVSSFIGAVLAIFFGAIIYPTSGRNAICQLLAKAFHNFVLISDGISLKEYRLARGMDVSQLTREIVYLEYELAPLYFDTPPLLHAVKNETNRFRKTPYKMYESAVLHARDQEIAIWRLHHLGGMMLHGATNNTIFRRQLMEMDVLLSNSYSLLSFALFSKERLSPPALRPVAAARDLLKEKLDDFLIMCYRDEAFMKAILDSNSLKVLTSFITYHDILLDISESLHEMYTFLYGYLDSPKYVAELKEYNRSNLFS